MKVVLVSGGKDSTATLLLALQKLGKERVVPVFCDTGWESRHTYAYLDYLESKLGIEIVRLKHPDYSDLPDLILKKKRFPSAKFRYCTCILKIVPLALYVAENEISEIWMGIRSQESQSRQKRYGHMTEEDTVDYYEFLRNSSGYIPTKDKDKERKGQVSDHRLD